LLNVIPPFFLSHLAFDNAPEVYLPEDQPAVILEKELRQSFPEDKIALILFKSENLFGDEFLNSLNKASKQIQSNELVDRVLNVTQIEHISGTEDGFEVSLLLGKDNLKQIKGEQERFNYAQQDRFANKTLIGKNKDYMAIVIRPHRLNSTIERKNLMFSVQEILKDINLSQYISGYSGSIIVEIEQFNSMIRDTLIFVPGTVIIGLLLIWFMFRKFIAVAIAGIVSGAVVNSVIMLYIFLSLPYTLISSMIPPLLSSLTTAFLIHLFTYLQLASSYGMSGVTQVRYAYEQIRKPALFTTVTTILGLSSLSVSPIPPIQYFGLTAASGVLLLYLIIIFLIPSILVKFDNAPWMHKSTQSKFIDRILKSIVRFSIRKAGWVIITIISIIGLGIPFLLSVNAETNLLKFFSEKHPVTLSTTLTERELTGVNALEIDLYGNGRDSLKKLSSLKQIKQLQSWLENQPEVDKANSIVDFVEEMHKSFHNNNPEFQMLPDNNQLISQYFFIYDGNDVFELVNSEFDKTRIVLSVNEHRSGHIRLFIERVREYLKANIQDLDWDVGGYGRLFSDQDELLISGQVYSLLTATLLIFVMMFILWGRLSDAILTMLPNLSPIIGIFIIMGVFNIWLDMATAMIASVAIGIAVDDTIHLYHNYKKRLNRGSSVIFSLIHSYYKTGRAILVTTIILSSQFLLLSFSDFIPTAHFGLLTAIGLIMAFIFDLLLLPSLIIIFFHKPHVRRQ